MRHIEPPKDGTAFLGFCGDYQIVCYWSDYVDDGNSWCTHSFGRQKGWNDFHYETHNPTHWMPLPKLPSVNHE